MILLDHCDNCASGGTMDTTCVLRAVLAAQLTDVCFFGIFDLFFVVFDCPNSLQVGRSR